MPWNLFSFQPDLFMQRSYRLFLTTQLYDFFPSIQRTHFELMRKRDYIKTTTCRLPPAHRKKITMCVAQNPEAS